MEKRSFIPLWVGIILLSGMFLLGQQTWAPPECVDTDNDGYGNPASRGCDFPLLDCDDDNEFRNPGEAEGPFGHGSCSDGIDNDCNSFQDNFEPKCDEDDLNVTVDDFGCISEWERGDLYFFINKKGYQAEARQVAQDSILGDSGTFPPGTIIQVLPTEAMVKRAPGWNPETHDWEFFNLAVSADPLNPTTIIQRGGAEVTGMFALNCFNCHNRAEPQWDLICRKTHGCNALPFSDDDILGFQDNDPRCD